MQQNLPSKLLINEPPLQVLPTLAKVIGLNEAIVLQQMQYWLHVSKHQIDGFVWIYNTYEEWQVQFPFWSNDTIYRAIRKLEKLGLIVSGNYNPTKFDQTKWYRIDYDKLNATCENHDAEVRNCITASCGDGLPQDAELYITETNTETNTRYLSPLEEKQPLVEKRESLDSNPTTVEQLQPVTPPPKKKPKRERLPEELAEYMISIPPADLAEMVKNYGLDEDTIQKEASTCYKWYKSQNLTRFWWNWKMKLEMWLDKYVEKHGINKKDTVYAEGLKFDNPPDMYDYSEADLEAARSWHSQIIPITKSG
jgi:hypothetical protein